MIWREATTADLMTCLEIQPACIGDGLVGRRAALCVWNELLSSPSFLGMVIESERPVAGHRIVGCGLGVFVSPRFADQEIANPQPGLNARIIASCEAGKPVVMNYEELGMGNATNGVDFVNMYGTWREQLSTPKDLAEVQALMTTSFLETHAGYRLNRVLKEAIGVSRMGFTRGTGIWRVLAEFPEADSALFKVVSKEIAFDLPYSVAGVMYNYNEPVLGLVRSDQQLLIAALKGATDPELALQLGVRVTSIKKRWISVFARIENFKPEVLGISGGKTPEYSKRGPQKRHHVLSYVRAHPEELRPYIKPKVVPRKSQTR
jgi:hypothetical protein